MVVFSISKYLNRLKKIPSVVMNSAKPRFYCSRDLCVVWVIQNELLELLLAHMS